MGVVVGELVGVPVGVVEVVTVCEGVPETEGVGLEVGVVDPLVEVGDIVGEDVGVLVRSVVGVLVGVEVVVAVGVPVTKQSTAVNGPQNSKDVPMY